ncbi:MAG: D-alanine--D-alanine ligase [Propionibacteriaceae bacterium]|jgi:D-alanine-D-alanine ligase|nr:D-alanine--D-alanine ligase [Propionibacteriaceae bacterium]
MQSLFSRIRVALIFGGVSSEQEISCATAGGIFNAIDRDRFEVVGIGIAKDGRWVRVPDEELAGFKIDGGHLPALDGEYPEAVLLRGAQGVEVGVRNGGQLRDLVDVDVAFALLHGPFGEDGTIQGFFEMLGLRYVGAGVAASAMVMDKDLTKKALATAGIPVVPWLTVGASLWAAQPQDVVDRVVGEFAFPVFVKPARSGSSIGMSRVRTPDELSKAMALALAHDPKVIIEQGLVGAREIELGVIGGRGGGRPRVSVPGEVVVAGNDGFYDYAAKYLGRDYVSLDVPADVPEELAGILRQRAGQVFEVMQVEGLARVDFFVKDGIPLVNELNTMPGFTSKSLFPLVWEAAGVSYSELISELIHLALERPLGVR